MFCSRQILDDRLNGLSVAIEQASIDKSHQEKVVYQMKKELRETGELVNVSMIHNNIIIIINFIIINHFYHLSMQALSPVSKGWLLESVQLSTALSHHIGPLSLGMSFLTYLTKCPPHITQDVIVNTLKPCIVEIGFTIDKEPVFNGLLDQLCPTPSTLYHKTLPSSVSSSSVSSPVPFQEQVDSISDQPDHLSQEDTNEPMLKGDDRPNLLDQSDQPDHLSHTNNSTLNEQCYGSQYYELCEELVDSLNPTRFGRLTARLSISKEAAHDVFLDIIHMSWNKWPLICDPENSLEFGSNWITLNGNEWLVEFSVCLLSLLKYAYHFTLCPLHTCCIRTIHDVTHKYCTCTCLHVVLLFCCFIIIIITALCILAHVHVHVHVYLLHVHVYNIIHVQ